MVTGDKKDGNASDQLNLSPDRVINILQPPSASKAYRVVVGDGR
jgi:hypothetical protein